MYCALYSNPGLWYLSLLRKTGFVGQELSVGFSVFSSPFVCRRDRQVNLETSTHYFDCPACSQMRRHPEEEQLAVVTFLSCEEAAEPWKKGILWLQEDETKAVLWCPLNFVSKMALRREPDLCCSSGTALCTLGWHSGCWAQILGLLIAMFSEMPLT